MKLHELRQKRDNIARQMRSLHDEIGENDWIEEQRTKWKGMKTELDGLDERIAREEELRAIDASFVTNNQDEVRAGVEGNKDGDEQRKAVFDKLLRQGFSDLNAEERAIAQELRAQGTSPAESGGYTVPKQFLNRIYDQMKAYGGLASICQLMVTSTGNTIEWPTSDGTSEEGELLGENSAANEQDVTFGTQSLGAKKLSSKIIRVSNELLQDSAVNLEAYLGGRIAERIGRTESRLAVQGTGTGTPAQNLGLLASITGTLDTAAAGVITWQDLNKLRHAVDPAYRAGGRGHWLFNDATLQLIEEMVDAQNRPLWLPSIQGGTPATVLNHPYQVDQAMPVLAAGAKCVAFGDFQRFILRRVQYMVIKRLTERYAEYDQVGFLAFHRFDTVLEDTSAIKALTGHA